MSKRPNGLWWENEDGVHYLGAFDEFMLCGDAFDGNKGDFGEMRETDKRVVTCPRCIRAIKHLRGKRIKFLEPKE